MPFALIYRPGADTACEDLARAIAFLYENADELQISMDNYSLWGGSAGARMAAWLGSYGTAAFGEDAYPAPAAVIMQYTGLSDVTGNEPPTYACVGTNDGIASYRSMENYISRIQRTEQMHRSKCSTACATGSDLARELWLRGGSIVRSASGRETHMNDFTLEICLKMWYIFML